MKDGQRQSDRELLEHVVSRIKDDILHSYLNITQNPIKQDILDFLDDIEVDINSFKDKDILNIEEDGIYEYAMEKAHVDNKTIYMEAYYFQDWEKYGEYDEQQGEYKECVGDELIRARFEAFYSFGVNTLKALSEHCEKNYK